MFRKVEEKYKKLGNKQILEHVFMHKFFNPQHKPGHIQNTTLTEIVSVAETIACPARMGL